MPNNLDVLPADLLSRLDQALPLLTQSAIRGEFLQGVSMLCAGLFICLGFLLLCWYVARREEYMVCLTVALFGFGMMVMSIPSVAAPELALAREIVAGL